VSPLTSPFFSFSFIGEGFEYDIDTIQYNTIHIREKIKFKKPYGQNTFKKINLKFNI
jgi:hypothetical protein